MIIDENRGTCTHAVLTEPHIFKNWEYSTAALALPLRLAAACGSLSVKPHAVRAAGGSVVGGGGNGGVVPVTGKSIFDPPLITRYYIINMIII